MSAGKLILVPTPIGNLEDITLRALSVLKAADLILAEDTRTSGKLLKHYDISTPMRSYHMHNEHRTLQSWLEKIRHGATIALISDAGTPGISDPGYLIARACIEKDHRSGFLCQKLEPGFSSLFDRKKPFEYKSVTGQATADQCRNKSSWSRQAFHIEIIFNTGSGN